MSQENKMGTMPIPKLVINMSLPMMFSLLVQSLYNIVDGIFVAKLSEEALTATSLAYPVQILMIAVSVGTSVGVNAVLSRSVGAKQYDRAEQIATTGMVLSIISAAVFVLLGIFGRDTFISFFTKDPVLGQLCGQYLGICMIWCMGIFIATMAQRVLQAVGNTFDSMLSLVAGAITNVVLDPIMIFGLLGCPAMGIRGAAIATVIGQWVNAAVALTLNHYHNKEVHFAVHGFRLRKAVVSSIYKVGVPTIVMQAMGSFMVSAVNIILMPFSSTVVAFFGVYYKLQSFLFMPMNGLGQAAIPIVGYNYGAKKWDRINETLKTMIPAAAIFSVAATVVFWIFPRQLLGLFSASAAMLEVGVPALRIISVTFAFASVTMILGYAASGLGNGVINMVGTVIRQFALFIPLAYAFARIGGVQYVWYALLIAETVAVIYSVISVRIELRRKTAQTAL